LKDNIKPLENVLDTIKSIQGVNFEWLEHDNIKNDPYISMPSAFQGKSVGFIAQDLEKIVPEVILWWLLELVQSKNNKKESITFL
jgi:hypothetical protein